jgi:hypothetical protein
LVVKDVSIELDDDPESGFLFFEFHGLEGERVDLVIPNHMLEEILQVMTDAQIRLTGAVIN